MRNSVLVNPAIQRILQILCCAGRVGVLHIGHFYPPQKKATLFNESNAYRTFYRIDGNTINNKLKSR